MIEKESRESESEREETRRTVEAERAEDLAQNPPTFYTKNLWPVHSSSERSEVSEPSKERNCALESTLTNEKKSRKIGKDDRKVQDEWVDTQTVNGTAAARSKRGKHSARLLQTR